MAVSPGSSLSKGKGAGAKRKGGAEHKTCDLVRNEEIVCERLGTRCGENLPGGKIIMWNISGTGRREVFAMKGFEKVVMVMVK